MILEIAIMNRVCDVATEVTFMGLEETVSDSMFCAVMELWNDLGWKRP